MSDIAIYETCNQKPILDLDCAEEKCQAKYPGQILDFSGNTDLEKCLDAVHKLYDQTQKNLLDGLKSKVSSKEEKIKELEENIKNTDKENTSNGKKSNDKISELTKEFEKNKEEIGIKKYVNKILNIDIMYHSNVCQKKINEQIEACIKEYGTEKCHDISDYKCRVLKQNKIK